MNVAGGPPRTEVAGDWWRRTVPIRGFALLPGDSVFPIPIEQFPMTSLPALVREYHQRNVARAASARTGVVLQQRGEMRLGPTKPWMPFKATQSISAQAIQFHWRARFRMAGFIPGVVIDTFENGQGRLDAWLLGFIPIARGRGTHVDRSEAQRYLAELVWCPMALASNRSLQYQAMSEDQVRVSTLDDDTYVDLHFDEYSDIRRVTTSTRYRDKEMIPWEGRFDDYRQFDDVRLPTRGEVGWIEPAGRFVYWRGHITAVKLTT